MDNVDILIDQNGDDMIVNGDFSVGDGRLDDCSIILKLTTGACKYDPILGPNIIRMMNGKLDLSVVSQAVKVHFARDNKTLKSMKVVNGALRFEIE